MQNIAQAGLIATSSRTAPLAQFHRPENAAAALAAWMQYDGRASFVAGGTDLCAQYNEGLAPVALIALDRVAELRQVTVTADELRIGSIVTHAVGATHPLICRHFPGFAQAWGRIANIRIRFWATIGGNLLACRTRYEMSLLLTAIGAVLRFLLPSGEYVDLHPQDVWLGRIPTPSLLHHIAIPLSSGPHLFCYQRSLRPIVTLAYCQDARGARGVIATEWLRPVLLPVTDPHAPDAAAQACATLPEDFYDAASSRWYLVQAGQALLRRAIAAESGHA